MRRLSPVGERDIRQQKCGISGSSSNDSSESRSGSVGDSSGVSPREEEHHTVLGRIGPRCNRSILFPLKL